MSRDFDSVRDELLDVNTPYGALLTAVIFGFVAWAMGRALSVGFNRLLKHPKYVPSDRTAINFLAQLLRLGIYLFAFVMWAEIVPSMHRLGTAWLASVGVVSVVLGLAAQNTLGNLIAGISLLLYRPFNLGDRLQVTAPSGLETGVVESLNLGYTVLRTADNRLVVIPNSAMTSQTSINLSLTDARKLCVVTFRISHDADVDKARNILLAMAKDQPRVLEVQGCPVTGLGTTSVALSLKVWCADAQVEGDLRNELLEAGRRKLVAGGVGIFRAR